MNHRILLAAAVGVLAAAATFPATAAIVSGQVDVFEDGTLESWDAGNFRSPNPPVNIATGGPAGAGDSFLRLTSNGSGFAGGKLVAFNINQWAGNYLAADIDSIRMQVNNLGSTNLVLRLILSGAGSLTTQTPITVPAGSGWNTVSFSLAPTNLTGGTFNTIMSGVFELNLVHSPNVISGRSFSPPITAQLGLDNITAVTDAPPVPNWNVDADGNWSQPANWTAVVPNAVGATAVLGSVITAARTMTVDAPITIGRLDFDDASSYTVAGANALTLNAVNGSAQVNVNSGSHTISAPLSLADNTAFTVTPAGSNLSITQPITASTQNVTNSGAGTLTIRRITAAGLSIDDGKVVLAPNSGTSVLNSLVLGSAAENLGAPPVAVTVQAVPEPTSAALLAIGLAAAVSAARYRAGMRKRSFVG